MALTGCLAAEMDHLWMHRFQDLRLSPPSPSIPSPPPTAQQPHPPSSLAFLDEPNCNSGSSTQQQQQQPPVTAAHHSLPLMHKDSPTTPAPGGGGSPSLDPLTVQEVDLERRCLGTLTDALRAVVQYAHSSYRVPISFQVKRFDRAQGQIWVKVSPEEVPEGYDLKYLLQHIKFYENIPRYARLLNVEDYKLKATCQYFLDLQSRPNNTREEGLTNNIGRLRETINRASKFVQEMSAVGIMDRDVVHQLGEALGRLHSLDLTVDKFCVFQQNRYEVLRMTHSWFSSPEKEQLAARQIHQQMSTILDDPDVARYILQVVAPRLGLVPLTAF
uniref:Uncharacterized protein n=1 Tax=Amphimedon queenslandica TaxID=400682 RepID=A0A1X7VKQ4_AMPQE